LGEADPPIDVEAGTEMIIVYADGAGWPALWVAKRCVDVWEQFLRKHGLLR
jgi:hypothetical protein